MSDYTSEEIQEVYRKQRERREQKGGLLSFLFSPKEVADIKREAITEAIKELKIERQRQAHNWNTNERA